MSSTLRWVASWFKGEAHAIEEPPMLPLILPEFNHIPLATREEEYVTKIILLRDELVELRASNHWKDAELHKQTARTAELEYINASFPGTSSDSRKRHGRRPNAERRPMKS
jgi:hypothetical protein